MKIEKTQTIINFNEREKHIINHFMMEIVDVFQRQHCFVDKKISCDDCPFVGLCNITTAEGIEEALENGINYPSEEL